MKKLLFLTLMLITITISASAQKTTDVLYLKNGSIIYGKLTEVTDEQYKMKSSDGSIFIFSRSEVDKFANERLKYDGRKKDGLGFSLEAGAMIGAQNSNYVAPFSFNFIINRTVLVRSIFGLGSGVEFLGQPFMPVFIEYKYLLTEKKTCPFIFARVGGLFHLNGEDGPTDAYSSQYNTPQDYKGGLTMTIGTGISWAKEDNESYLTFAYRNANTSYSQKTYSNQTTRYENSFNRLEIKYGFRF
jgi:hypothetical protein